MKKKLNAILLIDDNPDDNFFHTREIKKVDPAIMVVTKSSGAAALEYIKQEDETSGTSTDLIFLDINMPGMNGWDFLEEYHQLSDELNKRVIIIMLTNSENPDDVEKAKGWNVVAGYKTKPLTQELLQKIIESHFH